MRSTQPANLEPMGLFAPRSRNKINKKPKLAKGEKKQGHLPAQREPNKA
jgi:hypothetical protein